MGRGQAGYCMSLPGWGSGKPAGRVLHLIHILPWQPPQMRGIARFLAGAAPSQIGAEAPR